MKAASSWKVARPWSAGRSPADWRLWGTRRSLGSGGGKLFSCRRWLGRRIPGRGRMLCLNGKTWSRAEKEMSSGKRMCG